MSVISRTSRGALLTLLLPIAANAATFTESGDAGASIAGASPVLLGNPTQIDGLLADADDADLFGITLTAGVPFLATSSGAATGPVLDTQLILFDALGKGLAYNDDVDVTDFYSRLSFTPTTTGVYYLGIAGIGLAPRDALGTFVYLRDPFNSTAQLGASAAGPLDSFVPDGSGLSDFGGYRVAIEGASPIPEPGTLLLMALGLGGLSSVRPRSERP